MRIVNFFGLVILLAGVALAQALPPGSVQVMTPLPDLGTGQYRGFTGGLYPDGQNTPPADYLKIGQARARKIIPLGPTGRPDLNGRVVLLSIGMSNTSAEFEGFIRTEMPGRSQWLTLVNGAQGGQDIARTIDPKAEYWMILDQRLARAGVTAAQVQAVWLKQAVAGENRLFPDDARGLQQGLQMVITILQQRFPNLQIVYLSSRIYAGYAVTKLNPEPYAYESGFAVKWLIEDRIKACAQAKGDLPGPWLAWGPYLWTNGENGRKDGLTWVREDCGPDGTHPSETGQKKVADLLLKFFQTDATAKGWFNEPK